MLPPHMQKNTPEDQKNLFIAAALCFAIVVFWNIFYVAPQMEEHRKAEQERVERLKAAQEREAAEAAAKVERGEDPSKPDPFGTRPLNREEAVAAAGARVPIETPSFKGSIALQGGRIDELSLLQYRQRLDKGSDPIELLWPVGSRIAYYPVFGWTAAGGVAGPSLRSEWALAPGSPRTLTPGGPITLVWENESGQRFIREISVDDQYMFTVTQRVENRAEADVLVKPYASIRRQGTQALWDRFSGESAEALAVAAGEGWLIHRGPITVADGALEEPEYEDLAEAPNLGPGRGRGLYYRVNQVGWIGFTDKYWMTALAPKGKQEFGQSFETNTLSNGDPVYGATIEHPDRLIKAGETFEVTTFFFAGSKKISALRDYEYLIDGNPEPTGFFGKLSDFFFYSSQSRFIDAIDWGWFFFLTKPITELLLAIYSLVGNMGVAIILLTVLFKTLLFPLAYKSYVAMSKLKKLQPQMKEIQESAGDDRMKMQQDIMALYKKEKVNPAAGCLPILVQIPIFFSLYKVLFISIELRHAPFFGWIQDLSAPDPTSIFNLFGLLPYDVPMFLLIGVWPLLMGISMWVQQMLNPAPTDPVQEKIFAFLPIIFTFLLAGFASGLVIYWTANNLFTIIQQWSIMRSQGVEIDLIGNARRQFGLEPKRESPG